MDFNKLNEYEPIYVVWAVDRFSLTIFRHTNFTKIGDYYFKSNNVDVCPSQQKRFFLNEQDTLMYVKLKLERKLKLINNQIDKLKND
jgi:hypothetical protein